MARNFPATASRSSDARRLSAGAQENWRVLLAVLLFCRRRAHDRRAQIAGACTAGIDCGAQQLLAGLLRLGSGVPLGLRA